MKVQLTERVLELLHWHPVLDVIVSVLQQPGSRHAFDLTHYSSIAKSRWLAHPVGVRASTAELIRSSAKAASRDVAGEAVILRVDDLAPQSGETLADKVIRINPLGALTILMQPLHLIVEDETSDGAFVLWMARCLGRDAIRQAYNSGRLLFRHAGGKGQFEKSASALTFGVWPRQDKPILSLQLRAVALLDSDSRFPGDSPNRAFVRAVKPHVAFVHTLKGRSIENYVPLAYARRRLAEDGLGEAADAFFRMSEPQRDHFPIKRGLLDGGTPPKPQEYINFLADQNREQAERELFRSINPSDWTRCAGGFGDRFSSIYREPKYRCEPGDRTQLTPGQQAEMNEFLTKLIQFL